jgi:hypothetical protein
VPEVKKKQKCNSLNGHQAEHKSKHEADVGETYDACGVQFTCKLVFVLRIAMRP